jgi:hypothetical protein
VTLMDGVAARPTERLVEVGASPTPRRAGDAGVRAGPPDAAPLDAALADAAQSDAAPATLVSLRVDPEFVALRCDQTLDLRAVAELSDGTQRDLTSQANWAFADPEVASISDDPATPGGLYPQEVRETTLTVAVGELISALATVQVSPLPGAPPLARLICPRTGEPGEVLRFDGSASSDPDGAITAWLFDFGDDGDPPGSGGDPVVEHAFEAPNRYDVRLTVVDGNAASDMVGCDVEVAARDESPMVRPIEPEDGQTVSPGETIAAVIDGRAGAGRLLVGVAAILDGVWVGAVDAEPYRIEIGVPAEATPGATLVLLAQAAADRGWVGTSAPVLVVGRAE